MQLRCIFLIAVALLIDVSASQWITLSPVPVFSASSYGVAVPFEDRILHLQFSEAFLGCPGGAFTAHILDTHTGVWTTVPSQPSALRYHSAAVMARKAFVMGGWSPYPATSWSNVFVYDADADTWETKATLPNAKSAAVGVSDGQSVYCMGGQGPTVTAGQNNVRYNPAVDQWTSLSSTPVSASDMGGGYNDGSIFVTGGRQQLHEYVIDLDAWTTKASPPLDRGSLGDMADVASGFLFVLGGSPAKNVMERYRIATDSWTTLTSCPISVNFGAVAITLSGLFVQIGHQPSTGVVHAFDTGLVSAWLVGDPVIATFGGDRLRVNLWPGVFNLLTTRRLVINALVDVLDTLPPDENTVVTMVGVTAVLSEGEVWKADCNCDQHGMFVCSASQNMGSSARLHHDHFVLDFPNFTLKIVFNRRPIHVMSTTADVDESAAVVVTRLPPSSWLDVHVVSHGAATASPTPCVGLLCVREGTVGEDTLKALEVGSGCLMSTEVLAAANVFRLDSF